MLTGEIRNHKDSPMLTGEIRNQVDRIWDTFWTGGISNPLEVIEQLTYLLFIKRLDEVHTRRENRANTLGQPIEDPIFGPDAAEPALEPLQEFRRQHHLHHHRRRGLSLHQDAWATTSRSLPAT